MAGVGRDPAWWSNQGPLHENHESPFYLVRGEEVELWTGERLEQKVVAQPGDYFYIPRGVPHVGVNRTAAPADLVGARTDPKEQDRVVLRPELDSSVL